MNEAESLGNMGSPGSIVTSEINPQMKTKAQLL